MTPRQFVLTRHPEACCFTEDGGANVYFARVWSSPSTAKGVELAWGSDTAKAWRKAAKKIREAEAKGGA